MTWRRENRARKTFACDAVWGLVCVAVAAAAACGSRAAPVVAAPMVQSPPTVVSAPARPLGSAQRLRQGRQELPFPADPTPPQGYVRMLAVQVLATSAGYAVALVDEETTVMLPIFVGGTEARSISLRLAKERFARPLTHDLIDSILLELGGRLWKVQVDELRDDVFIGSVFVRTDTRLIELDARPSDAIALAIDSNVPIYVAQIVLDKAAIPAPKGDFPEAAPPMPPAPPLPKKLTPRRSGSSKAKAPGR